MADESTGDGASERAVSPKLARASWQSILSRFGKYVSTTSMTLPYSQNDSSHHEERSEMLSGEGEAPSSETAAPRDDDQPSGAHARVPAALAEAPSPPPRRAASAEPPRNPFIAQFPTRKTDEAATRSTHAAHTGGRGNADVEARTGPAWISSRLAQNAAEAESSAPEHVMNLHRGGAGTSNKLPSMLTRSRTMYFTIVVVVFLLPLYVLVSLFLFNGEITTASSDVQVFDTVTVTDSGRFGVNTKSPEAAFEVHSQDGDKGSVRVVSASLASASKGIELGFFDGGSFTLGATIGLETAGSSAARSASSAPSQLTIDAPGGLKINSTTMTVHTLNVTNTLAIPGGIDIPDNIAVNDLRAKVATVETLRVFNSSILSSNVSISGATALASSLSVQGGTDLGSSLTVRSTSSLVGNVDAQGDVVVQGNLTGSSSLSVSGNANLSGTVEIGGAALVGAALTAGGAATLQSTLQVSGATTLGNSLSVAGSTTISSSLSVNGGASLSNVSATAVNAQSLNVSGETNTGAFRASDAATFSKDVSVNGEFTVQNITYSESGAEDFIIQRNNYSILTIDGNGVASVLGLTVEDSATIDQLTVSVKATMTQLEITGRGDISGDLAVGGTMKVGRSSSFPICNSSSAGTFFVKSTTSGDDEFSVCMFVSGSYGWRKLTDTA